MFQLVAPRGPGQPGSGAFLLVLFPLLLAGAQEGDPLDRILRALDEKQRGLTDVEAAFEQKQVSHLLEKPDISRGRLAWRQGKFRMEWTEPRKVILTLDSTGIMQYFPDENRAERMPSRTDKDLTSIFPGFGQASEEMKKTYEIRLLSGPDDGTWKLELKPRRKQLGRLLSGITLWLDPESGVPTRMRFDDPNRKDYVETTFSETKVNQGIPESRTRLDLPEGVRITTVTGNLPF